MPEVCAASAFGPAAPGRYPVDLATLVSALDLHRGDDAAFYGEAASPSWPIFPGSQILGSAVVALERTWPDYTVRSLQCLFMRSGRPDRPGRFAVTELHRGRSFVTAKVAMSQDGVDTCELLAVLGTGQPSAVQHGPAFDPPNPPPPSGAAERAVSLVPWELHQLAPESTGPGLVRSWSRCAGAPVDPTMQRALFAHLCEPLPIAAGLERCAGSRDEFFVAVLTHTMALHEPFDLAEWLLVEAQSPYAGRGLLQARSETYTAAGALVATVTQSAVVRPLQSGPAR